MRCFINYDKTSEFPIENLPYGVFSTINDNTHCIGVAIGDEILNLNTISPLFTGSLLHNVATEIFQKNTLNAFMALEEDAWIEARKTIQDLLSGINPILENDADLRKKAFVKQSDAIMHLPVTIPNYTDFYSSLQHASNVGTMFRGAENAILPNWRHLPVGYHGRASSVVVSGTEIHRPVGQICAPNATGPTLCPTARLDFELEMAFFVGGPSTVIGRDRVDVTQAHKRIFGFVLMNDWSARDIQKWEYVPLGPFTAKNFATTISPWIVPTLALMPFLVDNTVQEPPPLPYLRHQDKFNFDIQLQVDLALKNCLVPTTVCKSNYKYLYWTAKQQLVHHTITGCNLVAGDLMASGTISGETVDSYGSMLELSWNGSKPIQLADGSVRNFLLDGDSVTMTAICQAIDYRIGFGKCEGTILPSIEIPQ